MARTSSAPRTSGAAKLAKKQRGAEAPLFLVRSGRDAGPGLAGDAGAAEPAIAARVLGEILLVIVLGEVERRRVDDLGGNPTKALRGERLLVHRPGGLGG